MEIAPEHADELLNKGLISPDTHASILGKMNDVLVGDNPAYMERMRSGSITPIDVASSLGRGYDAFVGAPTRAAISAVANGQNPISAAAGQVGRDPDTAPDFGVVGNAVADPFVLAGAGKGLVKAGTSMIEHAPAILGNEAGELRLLPGGGKSLRASAPTLREIPGGTREQQILDNFAARYNDTPEMAAKVQAASEMMQKNGAQMDPYINLAEGVKTPWGKGQVPMANPYFEIQGGKLGKLGKGAQFLDDPLNWMDQKWGVVRNALQKHQGPVEINTAQDLVGHEDYLNSIPKGSTVNLHYDSANDFGALTPGSASFKRLVGAAERLKAKGFNVNMVDASGNPRVASLPSRFDITKKYGAVQPNAVKGIQIVNPEE